MRTHPRISAIVVILGLSAALMQATSGTLASAFDTDRPGTVSARISASSTGIPSGLSSARVSARESAPKKAISPGSPVEGAMLRALQADLYVDDGDKRLRAAAALHDYIMNDWLPLPGRFLTEQQAEQLAREALISRTFEPVPNMERDNEFTKLDESHRADQQTLLAIADYLARRCGLPLDEYLLRYTRWTFEYSMTTTLQPLRRVSTQTFMRTQEFRDAVIVRNATNCHELLPRVQ